MGFWKKFGTIVGRVAVQAGIGALEAKASGKPITIGTVGPGVLVDVLKRRSEVPPAPPAPPAVLDIWEGDIRPGEVTVGYLAVWYRVDGKVGYRRIRYFTDIESAWQFADEKKSKVMRLAETDGRKYWVELEREKSIAYGRNHRPHGQDG